MLTDAASHNPQLRRSRRLRFAIALAFLSGIFFTATVIVMLIPNSVHLDTDYGDDIFFSCGIALSPNTEPYEEPGISACREVTRDHRRVAGSLAILGAVSTIGAGALIFAHSRKGDLIAQRRQRS